MGSALMGSLQMQGSLTEGLVGYSSWPTCIFSKVTGVLFPQSVKIHDFRSGPICVDPMCPQPSAGARRGGRFLEKGEVLLRGVGTLRYLLIRSESSACQIPICAVAARWFYNPHQKVDPRSRIPRSTSHLSYGQSPY